MVTKQALFRRTIYGAHVYAAFRSGCKSACYVRRRAVEYQAFSTSDCWVTV